MPSFDEVRGLYPGWKDDDILRAIAEDNGTTPEYVAGYLGYAPPTFGGELKSGFKRALGQTVQGGGQLAEDLGWEDNFLKQYGQEVIDANPSRINSLEDVAQHPGAAFGSAVGNAGAFLATGGALGLAGKAAGAYGLARTGAAIGGGLGQTVNAALPSYGGIREEQIAAGHNDPMDMLAAGAGAGTVGWIEQRFGLNKMLGLSSAPKTALREFTESAGATPFRTGIKEWGKAPLQEGAEELVQNPIEQMAAYQDPTLAQNLEETAFGGVMGFLGGLGLGGLGGARAMMRHGKVQQDVALAQGVIDDEAVPHAVRQKAFDYLSQVAERVRGTAEVDLLASGEKLAEDLSLANALGMEDYAALLRYQQQKTAEQPTAPQAAPSPMTGLPANLRGLGEGAADAFAGVNQVTPEQHAQREADLVAAFSEPYGYVGDRPVTVWEQQLREAGLKVPKNASAPIRQPGVGKQAVQPAAPAGPAQAKSQIAQRLEKNLTEMEEAGEITPEQAQAIWGNWNKTGKTVREAREFEKQLGAIAKANYAERNSNAAQAAKAAVPAVPEEAQSGQALPAAGVAAPPQIGQVVSALTTQQRRYWEARNNLGVTDDTNESDAQIAAQMGISRQRVSQLRKETLTRLARTLKDKHGLSIEQAREMLRTRGAALRQTEEADASRLGLSPAEQASTIEGEMLFGNENGAEASMGVVNSAGGTQSATETERSDEAAQFLKAHGGTQSSVEPVDTPPDSKTVAHAQAEAALRDQAGQQTTLWDYLPKALGVKPVDIEDAAQEWNDNLTEKDSRWEDMTFERQAQVVKLYIARYDGKVTADRYTQRMEELKHEATDERMEEPGTGKRGGEEGPAGSGAGDTRLRPGDDVRRVPGPVEGDRQEARPAEEGLTPEGMAREWDRAARALNLPEFAQLTEEQRSYILGSADMDEFNEAAREVAQELANEAGVKFSESDDNDLDFTKEVFRRPGLRSDKDVHRSVGGVPRAGWAEATIIRGKDGKPAAAARGANSVLQEHHFQKEALGHASGNPSSGLGVWTYLTGKGQANSHGGVVEEFYLDIRRPAFFDADNPLPAFDSVEDAHKFRERLRARGHDGIILDYRSVGGDQIAVGFDPEQFIYLSNVRFSEGPAAGAKAETVTANLKKLFFSPDKFNSMVTVVQSAAALNFTARQELSQAKDPSKVQAFVGTDGRVWMIADNIKPGQELAVFLHEVGVHLGLEKLIGKANMQRLAQQIQQWAKQEGTQEAQIAKAALARAGKSSSVMKQEEIIAYFVELAVKAGINPTAVKNIESAPLRQWFQTLWDAMQKALRKFGLNRIETLTAQDIVDLAYGAAHKELGSVLRAPAMVKFSETFDTAPTPQGFFGRLGEHFDSLLANPKGFIKSHGLGWLTLDQMADVVKSEAVRKYTSVMTQMQQFSKERVYQASLIDQDWAKLSPAVQRQLSDAMRAATRMQFDPASDEAPADEQQRTLKAKFNGLPAAAQDTYRRVRDYYAQSFEDRKQILLDAANQAKRAGKDTAAIDRMFTQMKGPYFPLARIGKWYSVGMSPELAALMEKKDKGTADEAELKRIDVLRKDKDHYITRAHLTRREAIRSADELRGLLGEAHFNVAEERIAQDMASMPDLARVEAYIAADLDREARDKVRGMMAQMYFDMLPADHPLKRAMKREGIHGENEDMRQVFAATAITSAHHTSRLKYANDLSKAMVDVRADGRKDETRRMVANELTKRNALAMREYDNPLVDRILQGSYFAHLGLSPAFILTNMSQVPMITTPWLGARYGYSASGRALAGAYADVTKLIKSTYAKGDWRSELAWEGKLNAGESELFRQLLDRNLLDITIEHDLGAVAQMRSSKLDDAIKIANLPVRVTELANRAVTGLAAYRLAVSKGMLHEAAIDHAAKAISETQLNYSGLNAPRHMQSVLGSKAIAKLMFQFRKYQQGMLYLVAKNAHDALTSASPEERRVARRTLAGLFGTTGLMAGAVGLPAMGAVTAIMNMVASAFGDDDDPFDAELEFRNWLTDVLGKDAAQAVAKGLPTLLGMDLSKRVGMGDLASPLPFARQGKTGTDTAANTLAAAAGASFGTLGDVLDGIQLMGEGQVAKGAEKVVPLKLAQNLIRAGRYADEGLTNRKGEIVLPDEKFSAWDLALRGAGFSPTMESTYYEANQAVEGARQAATDVRSRLLRDYAQAKIRGEGTADVDAEIAEYNARHPEKGLRIDFSSKLKAVQSRRKMQQERNAAGVRVTKQAKPFEERGRFAE